MALDASLLNSQYYKVQIKSKVEQSRERSSALLHLGVVAIGKGAFESPSTTVDNFTYLLYVNINKEQSLIWLTQLVWIRRKF